MTTTVELYQGARDHTNIKLVKSHCILKDVTLLLIISKTLVDSRQKMNVNLEVAQERHEQALIEQKAMIQENNTKKATAQVFIDTLNAALNDAEKKSHAGRRFRI